MTSMYAMPAWMGTLFLCVAVSAALALGVLVAYGTCVAIFATMQRQAGMVRKAAPAKLVAGATAEG